MLLVVTAIATFELALIIILIQMYNKKVREIKYYKPIEIRKDVYYGKSEN